MPSCNEVARGSKFASGENRAEFHLVLFYKKDVIRFLFRDCKCIHHLILSGCAPETGNCKIIISMYCKSIVLYFVFCWVV